MEVLVRMHRTWVDDPTVCPPKKGGRRCIATHVSAKPPQGRSGWREWWNHCFAKIELEQRMDAMKVCGALSAHPYTSTY